MDVVLLTVLNTSVTGIRRRSGMEWNGRQSDAGRTQHFSVNGQEKKVSERNREKSQKSGAMWEERRERMGKRELPIISAPSHLERVEREAIRLPFYRALY